MTRVPGTKWRPISRNFTNRKRTRTRGVVLHVAVSNATSLHGFFNSPGANASSHLYVDYKGNTEQYVDADKIAWTSGEGNATTIGIETAGMGNGKWTDAQLKELARLCRWAAEKYGFPLRKAASSRPSSSGIFTHRHGVDGNFPTEGVQRGRLQRAKKGLGEKWSSAYGKVCPGNERQEQWPLVVKMAQTHKVVKNTKGRKGAAVYKTPKIGGKNIVYLAPKGSKVRIVRFRGKWGETTQGYWIKLSKVKWDA
jgi:hypothetical protein